MLTIEYRTFASDQVRWMGVKFTRIPTTLWQVVYSLN